MSEGEHGQAGPLPTKRGEIGYVGEEQAREQGQDAAVSGSTTDLPARHPADSPSLGDSRSSTSSPGGGETAASDVEAARAPSPNGSRTSLESAGKRSILSFLGPDCAYGGLQVGTLLALLVQLGVLAGTIIIWVVIVTHIQSTAGFSAPVDSNSNGSDGSESSQQNSGSTNTLSSTIFVHAAFIIATIGELVFLERTIFRLRAERYAYEHPGEILPSSRGRADGRVAMGFNPFNRVDLPSYAAALRDSGVRTGDVEDNAIAVPPPPTYGDYRTSTLLLAGPRRKRESAGSQASSRRSSRPLSQTSVNGLRPLSLRPQMVQYQGRPLSYRSQDSSWEAALDADRARRLESILRGVEEGDVTDAPRPHIPRS